MDPQVSLRVPSHAPLMHLQKLPANPTLAEVDQIIRVEKRGNTIPVYVELPADVLTPVMAYLRIAKDAKYSFLLESVVAGEALARYSFIGAGPLPPTSLFPPAPDAAQIRTRSSRAARTRRTRATR
jgi:hypothetical protein